MTLKLVLPKGRINTKVLKLLSDCGIELIGGDRDYRPVAYGFDFEVKLLKSQNIATMVELGQHDIGFSGNDWIAEQNCNVEIIKDLAFDPVRIVACIPENWDWDQMKAESKNGRKLIVASEYKNISDNYLGALGINYQILRAYGATEVFPPEDADMIIDNTSTGNTIRANRLKIVDTVMTSSTQFIANKESLKDAGKKREIDDLLTLMQAVINGRERVLLEMNCSNDAIDSIVKLLPSMRYPTVSPLYQGANLSSDGLDRDSKGSPGFAIKSAVKKSEIRDLLPELIKAGATDILETAIRKAI